MFSKQQFSVKVLISLLFVMAFLPFQISAQDVIDIQVSPNVLNLQNQGQVVTIHTDISYGLVVGSSVTLNGVEIDHWKSDNQGNFVAKFLMSAIKNLPLNIGDYNTLTIIGMKTNGETFTGLEDILVVNNVPTGRK